jgi:hypothetical protein
LLLQEEELGWCDERRHARRYTLETAHLAGYLWTPPPNVIISIFIYSTRPQSKVLSRTRNPHAVCNK